jgi:hypothetical protein
MTLTGCDSVTIHKSRGDIQESLKIYNRLLLKILEHPLVRGCHQLQPTIKSIYHLTWVTVNSPYGGNY